MLYQLDLSLKDLYRLQNEYVVHSEPRLKVASHLVHQRFS